MLPESLSSEVESLFFFKSKPREKKARFSRKQTQRCLRDAGLGPCAVEGKRAWSAWSDHEEHVGVTSPVPGSPAPVGAPKGPTWRERDGDKDVVQVLEPGVQLVGGCWFAQGLCTLHLVVFSGTTNF